MSLNVKNIPYSPFLAVPGTRTLGVPIGLCAPTSQSPTAVTIVIDWANYGVSDLIPNFGVLINLALARPGAKLDVIQSVYIDNLQSRVPIYLYFPSTQYELVCLAGASGWFPVFTNDDTVEVIGIGFTTATPPTTTQPITTLFFTNRFVSPYLNREIDQSVSLWAGSSRLPDANFTPATRSREANYLAPGMGDLTAYAEVNLSGIGAPVPVSFLKYQGAALLPDATIIVTHATAWIHSATSGNPCRVQLTRTTDNIVIYEWVFSALTVGTPGCFVGNLRGNVIFSGVFTDPNNVPLLRVPAPVADGVLQFAATFSYVGVNSL